MEEAELAEIESRIEHYPPQARHDILRLTRELRRVYAASASKAPPAGSPLYDQPTGLLNSGAYGVRFAMARARATRFRKIFAVMSIEVDLASGGEERESAMKEIGARLERTLRATDTLARTGDSGFSIILEDLMQAGHAERVKQNAQSVLAEPVRVGAREIVPQAQVRLQFYPELQMDRPLKYDS